MKLTAHIAGFVLQLAQDPTTGNASPKRLGASASVAMLVLGAAAMIAMFIYHVIGHGQAPEYEQLGIGLGLLGIGSGGGAALHAMAKES